jgi:hypothetical protein
MSIGIVVYTNENNLPILKLFLDYLFKHNPNIIIPIYAVANKFTKSDLPYSNKVTYLSADVEWSSTGAHFASTLNNVLPQIKEDYIFYFCEDYIMTNPINIGALNALVKLIDNERIDMFSFASMYALRFGWTVMDVEYTRYGFNPDIFYYTDIEYKHAFSVQPCIWKKSSLHKLTLENPNMSLHDMDNSILKGKDQYNLACTNFKIYDDAYYPEYFIIGYKEIIRHGVFLMALNGHNHMEGNHSDMFMKKLIKENNLHNNPDYDRYIGFDKSLITW